MAIGSLIVKIGADISGIRRDAAKGAKSLGGLERGTKTLGVALKGLAVGLVAKELASMVNGALKAVDATAKLSRQLGGTIDGLQGLKLAANLAGVDSGVLSSAMDKLNQRLGEAARKGSGEAFEAFERLGLSARKLSAMDVDERMATIADRMVELGYSSQQTADTLRSFGIRQGEFANLISDGGAAIRAARQEIEDLGLSLSAVDAAKVEAANDAMERVKLASTAMAQRLAVQLAPTITAISNRFIDAAKDVDGMRNAVDTAVEVGVKGFGFFGDSVRGVHLVFKAVELAAWSLGVAVTEVFRGVVKANVFFVDLAIAEINRLIEAFNHMPGMDIMPIQLGRDSEFMKSLDELALNARTTTGEIAGQLLALTTEEWPSDKAAKLFKEIQAASQAAAENVVAHRKQIMDVAGFGDEGGDEKAVAEAEKLRERLAMQLQAVSDHALSEEELLAERHGRRLDLLNQALDQELLSLQQFAALSERLDAKHMEALAKIREKGMDRVNDLTTDSALSGLRQVTGMFMDMTSAASRENRKLFEVHKAFAITDAVLAGLQGVAKTMGEYSFPGNLAMAAIHAGLAAAQVAKIASQQFQGGGRSVAAPSVGAGAAGGGGARGAPAAQAAGGSAVTGGANQLVSINLQGDTFSRNTVLSLIDGINEAVSDGARIVVQ